MSRFLRVLMLLASGLVVWILWPIAGAVFAGTVLAVVIHPAQVVVTRWFRGRAAAAGAVVTLLTLVLVGGPLATVGALALREAADQAVTLANTYDERGLEGLFEELPSTIRPLARRAADLLAWSQAATEAPPQPAASAAPTEPAPPGPEEPRNGNSPRESQPAPPAVASPGEPGSAANEQALNRLAHSAASSAARIAAWLTESVLALLLDLAITVLVVFCLLVWGPQLVEWLRAMAPLPPAQTDKVVADLRETTRSVVLATLATAVAQALVATVGYAIAGIGSLPLAASVTCVAAAIPLLGGAVITCCVGVLQFLQGEPGWGLFLIGWGVIVVNLTENLVTPLLCSSRMRMPAALLLFAIIGGIAVFGALGIVAGPLIVAFFRTVVEIARGYEPHPPAVPTTLA